MTIKVNENTNIIYTTKHKNKTQNAGASFTDILNCTMNKYNSSCESDKDKKKLQAYENFIAYANGDKGAITLDGFGMDKDLNELNVAINHFVNHVFSGCITPDCFREDATLDIKQVIQNFGDRELSTTDLEGLNKDMEVFYKNGYLTEEDYDYVTNWILTKKNMLASKIKNQIEEVVKTAYDSIENRMFKDNNSEGAI